MTTTQPPTTTTTTPTTTTRAWERARLSLEGLSVGDAFGERFFATEPAVRLPRAIERREPSDPPRASSSRGCWRWTDDTAMSVSILEELASNGHVVERSLAARFGIAYRNEPDRGYGSTAHTILGEIAAGVPWQEAAARPYGGTGSKGNGGAMRAAPLGVFFDDLDVVVEEAVKSALPTHRHKEGIAGAVAIAVAAHAFAAGADDDAVWHLVLSKLGDGAVRENIVIARQQPLSEHPEDAADVIGNGGDVLAEDTVGYCLWCALRGRRMTFSDALFETVRGMGDIDTNCAIVGGLLAVPLGLAQIPAVWREKRERLPSSMGELS